MSYSRVLCGELTDELRGCRLRTLIDHHQLKISECAAQHGAQADIQIPRAISRDHDDADGRDSIAHAYLRAVRHGAKYQVRLVRLVLARG